MEVFDIFLKRTICILIYTLYGLVGFGIYLWTVKLNWAVNETEGLAAFGVYFLVAVILWPFVLIGIGLHYLGQMVQTFS